MFYYQSNIHHYWTGGGLGHLLGVQNRTPPIKTIINFPL